MSGFTRKALLQARLPVFDFKRFRGKINIQRPRQPHYDRARVIAVTTPIYPEKPVNLKCFKPSALKQQAEIVNPYNEIIAREVRNWFNHSQMVVVFHQNSVIQDDLFKVRVALHKHNMQLKSYGLAIIKKAIQDTKYEAILPLFDSHHCIVFSPEQKVAQLLKITRKVPQLILLGGIVENTLMSKNEFTNFATMPDLQTAQAQFVTLLNSAAGQIVNNLESHQKCLVNVLDVHAKSATNDTPSSNQIDDKKE